MTRSRIAGAGAAALVLLALLVAASGAPRADDMPLAERLEGCAACHGTDGISTTPEIPSLAGQPATFVETQMIYFRERLRPSEVMTPQAQGLPDRTIQDLAAHYAGLPPDPPAAGPDPALMARGRDLAKTGRCGTCHLPDFSGRAQMPRLAGQREDYLAKAMRDYRDETRGGPDTTMIDIMRGASDADIDALAHFLAHYRSEP